MRSKSNSLHRWKAKQTETNEYMLQAGHTLHTSFSISSYFTDV